MSVHAGLKTIKVAGSGYAAVIAMATLLFSVAACTPTVQVAMPSEPININLNVKIEHEIYIKVDKQLDDLFSESSGLF